MKTPLAALLAVISVASISCTTGASKTPTREGADSSATSLARGSDSQLTNPVVETAAGPWCGKEREQFRVGSLAVGPVGPIFFEVGPREEALVARLEPLNRQYSIFPAWLQGAESPSVGEAVQRLAPDKEGALIYAFGNRLLHRGAKGQGLVTIAGDPARSSPGASGDGGPASNSTFRSIRAITTDEAGSVYVADVIDKAKNLFAIRFINRSAAPVVFYPGTNRQIEVPAGNIATIFGPSDGSDLSFAARRGAKVTTQLTSLSVSGRRLYVALEARRSGPSKKLGSQSVIKVVNLDGASSRIHGVGAKPGELTTIAGRGVSGFNGDRGPAVKARFSQNLGLSADDHGNLYVADGHNHRIRRIDAAGMVTTVAGTGNAGFNGNDRSARSAQLNFPSHVQAVRDDIYISDSRNDQIRAIDARGQIRAVSGRGLMEIQRCTIGKLRKTGQEPPTKPVNPSALAVSSNGEVYFTVEGGPFVARLGRGKRVVKALGERQACRGNPSCSIFEGKEGFEHEIAVKNLRDLTFGAESLLYILGADPTRILVANLGASSALANGRRLQPGSVRGLGGRERLAIESMVPSAHAIAADGKGNLYIADQSASKVLHVNVRGRTRSIGAGTRESPEPFCCSHPEDLATDSLGNLYVLDTGRVWYFNLGRRVVEVNGVSIAPEEPRPVAGGGSAGLGGEGGPALAAAFKRPSQLAVSSSGDLYVADNGDATVRKIDPRGILTTVAGTGASGFNGEGLKGPLTQLTTISDLAVDDCDRLLMAEKGIGRVRRLTKGASCRS